jgi:hypothetical protein
VGSAPYVEASPALARRNIARCAALARAHGLHLDLHLDYHLAPDAAPLVHDVLRELRAAPWDAARRVTIGHATRLALFGGDEWRALTEAAAGVPLSFVALPQSDLYMVGRAPAERGPGGLAVRGTLDVPRLAREHGVRAAMAVNNVQNAFTPQGSADPLGLCPLGVATFQDGTRDTCEILLVRFSVVVDDEGVYE